MDFALVQRLAEGFRQMSADELSLRLADRGMLAPEAKQALTEVIATRPDGDSIRMRAAARTGSQRPSLGFWLGFLTFQFCAGLLVTAFNTWSYIQGSENATPQLLEIAAWHTYKWISWGNFVAVAVAGSLAVHAIYFGRTRKAVSRVIGCLWFISIGSVAIDAIATTVLFGGDFARSAYLTTENVRQLMFTAVISFLWSIYLFSSKRCQQRYPRIDAPAAQAKGA